MAKASLRMGCECLLVGLLSIPVYGEPQEPAASSDRAKAAEVNRAWLRRHLPELVPDQAARTEVWESLDRLSADQIQELIVAGLKELEIRRRGQLRQLREQAARENEFAERAARLAAAPRPGFAPAFGYLPPYGFPTWGPVPGGYGPPYGGRVLGYVPVITWLPEGVQLSAQGTVSPDGRHVRMNLMPFFSRVGPVYTFNYMTGETRRYDPSPLVRDPQSRGR